MSFNFIDTGGKVTTSRLCMYDSNSGYEADFSENGNVNGWTIYDGVHTYGCWNNFLFGTLYGETALIGRHNIFNIVEAESFYTIKIVMKLHIMDRIGTWKVPDYGKISWVTASDTNWSSSKEIRFAIIADNKWHTYYVNMGEAQYWQGDINNLKICPIVQDGRDGDEFFIRQIKIISVNVHKCTNRTCDYFSNYQHPCTGIGVRGTCTSTISKTLKYTITKDVNDVLLVNINKYGYEEIKLLPAVNVSGDTLAKMLSKGISKVNIGGYSEVEVEYNDVGQFIIYTGTITSDSTVTIGNSLAAVTLNFYDSFGNYTAVESVGDFPASKYVPKSSFILNTHQLLSVFDGGSNQEIVFNPFIYNIEGGRRDWLNSGLGNPEKSLDAGNSSRSYGLVSNANKTIIDFNHPFNASGRINKIYAALTLDNKTFDNENLTLENAEILFFRPLKDGSLKVLDKTVSIKNRDKTPISLYSETQEYVELDCDIFVNILT